MSDGARFSRLCVTLLASAWTLCAVPEAMAQGPPARVRFDAARLERVERQREVTGELRAVHRSRVAAEHEGLVTSLEVDVGDAVERGQVLARLDDTLLSIELERLRAERDAMEAKAQEMAARVAKARRDVERLESATGKGGVSVTELEDSRLDLRAEEALAAQARADLASAEARVRAAGEEVAKMTVRAPFSGSIVSKALELGEWVSEGGEVVEMVAIGAVDAWLDVPQRYVAAVASTDAGVRIVVDALDRTVESREVVVIAEGDVLARTFPVRVRLENPDGLMRPGMSVTGLVPTGEPTDVLTVHKDAVLRDDAGTFAYFDAGGEAMPVRLRKLWAVGERVVVESERVKPGMRLVVEGNERLYPSQPIVDMAGGAAERQGRPDGSGSEGHPGASGEGR